MSMCSHLHTYVHTHVGTYALTLVSPYMSVLCMAACDHVYKCVHMLMAPGCYMFFLVNAREVHTYLHTQATHMCVQCIDEHICKEYRNL